MNSNSSFVAWLLTVTTILVGGISVAALDNKNVTATSNTQASAVISGSYIVRLNDKTSAATVKATALGTATAMQTLKQQLIANGTLPVTANAVVTIPSDRIFTKSVKAFLIKGVSDAMLSSLRQTKGVIKVEPDMIVSVNGGSIKPEEDLTTKQGTRSLQSIDQIIPWGVKRVGGPIALKTVPNPQAKIFVLDTGISQRTGDLNIDLDLSRNFVRLGDKDENGKEITGANWEDNHGHGTHVAGTIAAIDNKIGVVGVVSGATVVAIRVLDDNGKGTTGDFIAGIEYVYINGRSGDVVNMSLGLEKLISVVNAAVENTASLGIQFAIAAGNEAKDATFVSPASASGRGITTVSCFDDTDTLCSFSNFGSVVDVSAPGKNILSLTITGGVTHKDGTSMSAPHIAGLLFTKSYETAGIIKGDKDLSPDPIWVYAGISPTPAPIKILNDLTFYISSDPFSGSENYWNLTRLSPAPQQVVRYTKIGTYPYLGSGWGWYTTIKDLPDGSYRFDLFDLGENGLTPPYYYILCLGLDWTIDPILKTGGSFGRKDSAYFTITTGSAATDADVVVRTQQYTFPAAPTTAVTPAPKPVKKVKQPKK